MQLQCAGCGAIAIHAIAAGMAFFAVQGSNAGVHACNWRRFLADMVAGQARTAAGCKDVQLGSLQWCMCALCGAAFFFNVTAYCVLMAACVERFVPVQTVPDAQYCVGAIAIGLAVRSVGQGLWCA